MRNHRSQSQWLNVTRAQRRAIASELRWLTRHDARQTRAHVKAQRTARRTRWWAHNGRLVRNALRVLALLLFCLLGTPLLVWAWDGGVRRVFPQASVVSLGNAWQVWAAVGLCAAAAVGVGFLFRDVMTWWRGR